MRAIVIYESHWGNTAALARAIAQGIGPEAQVMSTGAALGEAIAGVNLIVAGAPLLGSGLYTESMLQGMAVHAAEDPAPPDLAQPSMRAWLETLPRGSICAAAFETRIWWSPGSAATAILRRLEARGYRPVAKVQSFFVHGEYGPVCDGELERAKAWGAEIAKRVFAAPS